MPRKTSPVLRSFLWVPSLYLAMGVPFNVVNGTALRMYKDLGFGNSQITVALGGIGIAWSLKPLWAAFLDMYRTKKFFVVSMEFLFALLLMAVAMCIPAPGFFQISIGILWVAAFASSTQDICGDGIYLTALDRPTQANLAGVQSTFWVLGKVLAASVLITVVDWFRTSYGWTNPHMWQVVMGACAAGMVALGAYHVFFLPQGSITDRPHSVKQVVDDFLGTATTFFHKRAFWGMIAFVFLYRLGEGLILQEGQLFLQSSHASGGLGLTAVQVSNIDAGYGTVAGIIGGLFGGVFAGKMGLNRSLWILGLFLNLPHFTYIFLSHFAATGHGLHYWTIVSMVSIEKFGYGFGMVGNMIYMMQQLAPGRCTMTHYAFATALMNLVLVPTAMVSGPLGEWLGFSTFFLVVMFASVPSVLAAWRAPFPLKDGDGIDLGDDSLSMVTHDDPTRLTEAELAVQRLSGRASIYAMLNILTILIVDAGILGSLQGKDRGTGAFQLVLLLLVVVLKGFFSVMTFRYSADAARAASASGEANYLANARGAKVATLICAAATACVVGFAAWFVLR
jgi:PAT family beta-lactamase induction signal transducer AmpG